MTRLAAAGISLARGGRGILRGVHLAAQGGEFIAVIGPNGRGQVHVAGYARGPRAA